MSRADARKQDAKTEANKKENKVEVRKPAEAPKLLLPLKNDVIEAMNIRKQHKARVASAQGKARECLKHFHAKHITTAYIDNLIRIEKLDPEELRQELAELQQGCQIIGSPIQLSLHDVAYKDGITEAKAVANQHFKHGKTMDASKWPENSKEYEAYILEFRTLTARNTPGADKLSADELAEAITGVKPEPPKPAAARKQMEGVH